MEISLAGGLLDVLFNGCHSPTPLATGTLALHGGEEILERSK
jgi:hypothetical protein